MTDSNQSPARIVAAATPQPAQGGPTDPSHDERLRRGILFTDVTRPVAWTLTALFLLLIYAVPITEAVLEKMAGDEPVLLGLFQHAPSAARLRQFEEELEQASRAKEFVQPRVQLLLTQVGGVGNKKAIVGRDGFLFYEPGVRHLGGPGFLDPDFIASRERAARDAAEPPLHADPRPAIFAFAEALAKRDIRLILFPVPDKATLQPQELHGRSSAGTVARNRDFPRFVAELRQKGVLVFDPVEAPLRADGAPFLVQDTHWTPTWMQNVANELASFVNSTGKLPARGSALEFTRVPQQVARVGDVVDMLKLPAGQTLFSPQRVTVQQVTDASGNPWEPDPKSELLLLGDSFTNVFSMEFMGWGAASGLAPQLSAALRRGIDLIAQNDSGAFATREALARELAGGEDRLAGKTLVIWEFASRELSVGNWKPVDWNVAAQGAGEE